MDPVFKMGAQAFNVDLDNERSLVAAYNCTELDPSILVRNEDYEAPWCANLFNLRHLPYGFFHFPLVERTEGFPIWFDINLSEDQASYWYQYLEDGLLLDVLTKELTAELVTYNAELRMFSVTFIRFRFTDGGAIAVTHKLHTIRVELYQDTADYVRLTLEIALGVCVIATALYQIKVRPPL